MRRHLREAGRSTLVLSAQGRGLSGAASVATVLPDRCPSAVASFCDVQRLSSKSVGAELGLQSIRLAMAADAS